MNSIPFHIDFRKRFQKNLATITTYEKKLESSCPCHHHPSSSLCMIGAKEGKKETSRPGFQHEESVPWQVFFFGTWRWFLILVVKLRSMFRPFLESVFWSYGTRGDLNFIQSLEPDCRWGLCT